MITINDEMARKGNSHELNFLFQEDHTIRENLINKINFAVYFEQN